MATALSHLSRRGFGRLAAGAGVAATLPGFVRRATAQIPTETPVHGLSAFGDLKYGPDFTHFAYASPDAPDGGQMNLAPPNWQLNQSVLTFDTLNTFVLQGNAPPRLEGLYDSLMTAALDEPDSIYCALARSARVSADRNAFTFRLRPEARFSTGARVAAGDVAFSYERFKVDGHPTLQVALKDLAGAEALDAETVRLTFSGRQSFQDALGILTLPVLPEAHFADRPFADAAAIPGSGLYEIRRHEYGRFIEYGKRPDYWAKDMPFARGLNHFDTLRIDFFRDRQIQLEALKAGDITFREEFTSKSWATEYAFPAVRSGEVITETFPGEKSANFQCWALNQRRARFADRRVRRAINMCFDFAWTNENMFYGLYEHSDSCFENSPFKASGPPDEAELALLEPLRGAIPEAAFGEPWTQPVTDGSGQDREALRRANDLFREAGWRREGGRLVRDGEPFAFEFLIRSQGMERVYGKFIQTLRRLGVNARFRLVDGAQYQDRLNSFDFDMIGAAFTISPTPTRDTLAGLFGSETRDQAGSRNYVGMADDAVDTLIDAASGAADRASLTSAMRALDRVLRARLDWIPNIASDVHRVAYWDMFGRKDDKPDYGWPVESLWWYDAEKAAAIGRS